MMYESDDLFSKFAAKWRKADCQLQLALVGFCVQIAVVTMCQVAQCHISY